VPRSRRGSFPVRTVRRQTGWGLGPGGTSVLTLSGTGSSFLGSVVVLALEEKATLVRTRGELDVYLRTSDGVASGLQGAIGVAKATTAAVAAGIASVPTPITEADWDGWLFWHPISVHTMDGDTGAGPPMSQRLEVDSKAMRKWTQEETMYAAIEVVEIGAVTADVFFDSRMLVKLS